MVIVAANEEALNNSAAATELSNFFMMTSFAWMLDIHNKAKVGPVHQMADIR
jgi:hypothetical protein